MATETGPNVKDSSTGANIPVDGIIRTVTPTAPTAGQSVRQVVALGDGSDDAYYAKVDSSGGLVTSLQPIAATRTTGTITSATSSISTAIGQMSSAIITVHGTYAGVTFGINCSDDGGTTYYPQVFCIENSLTAAVTSIAPGTNATASYALDISGYTNIQVLASAWTSGTANIAINLSPLAVTNVVDVIVSNGIVVASGTLTSVATITNPVILEPVKSSFVYVASGITPVVGDTIVFTPGSSKNFRLRRLIVSGTATAAGVLDLAVTLRSTALTGGTSTTGTATPLDTGVTGPNSTIKLYTVVATGGGTLTGNIYLAKLFYSTTTTQANILDMTFAHPVGPESPTLVKNTTNTFGVNFSAAPSGGVFDVCAYFTEE